MVQNFNPINLDIKLEVEKERDMVKFIQNMCVPHEFVSFILKQENYNIISQPNLTYQKANNIVKTYLFEDWNRINHLKYKIAERFELIHFIYLFLFSKIYNRTNPFGIQRKNDFDFQFQNQRKRKQQKYDAAKEPSNYVDRKIEKHEEASIDFLIENNQNSTMVNIATNVNTKKNKSKKKNFRTKIRRKHSCNEKNQKSK